MAEPQRAALVTGGTRGIGHAIARALSGEGFRVGISGRDEESLRKAAADLQAGGREVDGFRADARSERDQKALVEWAGKRFGRLDVLVNNAGVGDFARVDEMSPDRYRAVVETNLLGVFYAIHYAAPLMRKSGGGFIVNIASLAAVNAFAGGSAYNASKFGLLGLSDAAMLDLRHDGIRIAAVLPGSVATDWMHSHGNQDTSWMLSPDDVAQAVCDLVRFPGRAIPSRLDLRPSRPPKK
ncbi:MAG TPA: SDR family oxidoreductase [Thermoanaerobaculia bacterium]|nr:SDR family oxidoreductase [Thermoanaerobaculia bacterium]